MDSNLLWLGIAPVIVFAVLESFTAKKTAVGFALLLAGLETIYSLVAFGRLDELTALSFALVGVLGLLSIKKNDDIYFKLQPAILGLVLAGAFFTFYFIWRQPLLNYMFDKYLAGMSDMPPVNRIPHYVLQAYLMTLSRDLIWWLSGHALLTALAAWRLSKWWWLAVRVPGYYLMLFLATAVAALEIRP